MKFIVMTESEPGSREHDLIHYATCDEHRNKKLKFCPFCGKKLKNKEDKKDK